MKYKILKFKNRPERYAIPMTIEDEVIEFVGCGIPALMNEETTLHDLQSLYPTLDFNEVDIVTVTLTEDKLLDEVDMLLALLEDIAHGEEGKRITEMRGKIQKI